MLTQTLASELLPYRDDATEPPYSGFGYNTYLLDAPRHYREEIDWIAGLFAARETTANSDYTLNAVVVLKTYEWPSWSIAHYRWDSTGRYLDRTDRSTLGVTLQAVKAGADDGLWAQYPSTTLYLLDPVTWGQAGTSYEPALFGVTRIGAFAVDRVRDLVVMHTSSEPNDGVAVHRLSTGERLGGVQVAGAVADIFPEEGARAYAVATNGVLSVIDYSTPSAPRVLSVLRQLPLTDSRSRRLAWDRQYRRVLAIDATSEDADGASTTRISGYYPRPQPVALTQPIPLLAPRAGRTVTVLTRAYGDTGEPIAGQRIDAPDATPTLASADGYGYARHRLVCTEAGTLDFEVSTP